MFLNDIEETFIRGKFQGYEIGTMLKLFLLLYNADMSRNMRIQQCGSLTSVDSDEPVQLPFKLRNSK